MNTTVALQSMTLSPSRRADYTTVQYVSLSL